MKHKLAIYALVRLHADIAGKIKAARQETKKLKTDLRHVQAVIHLFEPDFNLKSIIPRRRQLRNGYFKRRECLLLALDVLRNSERPMSARQIALTIIERRHIEPCERVIRTTTNTIFMALKHRKGKSVMAHDGMPVRWSLLP